MPAAPRVAESRVGVAGSFTGVTTLRPGRQRPSSVNSANAVVVLGEQHRADLDRLVDRDPLVNAMAAARLHAARTMRPSRLGATAIGIGGQNGLDAAAFHGANLIPIGGDAESWRALADYLACQPRSCSSIVGAAHSVAALWPPLSVAWGPARAIRHQQPLLVRDDVFGLVDDERVRALRPTDIDAYLPAAAAMFTEELGVSPLEASRSAGYRRRAEHLLEAGRAYGIVDRGRAVVFKADIGALTPHTCQVQGVWVRPDLRGRGLGTAAMAAVLLRALQLAPTVSLYVNDFNAVARALYGRLGMRQVAELSTVLY